jgi:multiple sugar transport system substrate-binding protein
MKFAKKAIALVGALAMAGSLAACGGSASSDNAATKTEIDPNKKISLTLWTWDSTLPRTIKGFEKKYPNITVKAVNAGTNKDEYTALDNALAAGSGAPDMVQIEYYALPQYALSGDVKNIADLGAKDYGDFYTPGTWSSVNINDGVYALPIDSGPMAFFYNKDVFDKAGVKKAPTTWDEFYQAAKKIKAAGSYITSDSGDAGFYDSMVWQAKGHPFTTDGENVKVDLTGDAGAKKWTDFWQKMIDENLIDTKTAGWSDDWNRSLGDGSIASLLTGAWMPYNLLSGAPQASGKWRVALMPTWEAGGTENSENGGSSLAIPKTTSDEKTAAAYKFMEYALHEADGIKTRVDGGAFPADNDTLKRKSFLDQTAMEDKDGKSVEYFGGQKFNEVLAQSAKNVVTGYQFLPFEVYARGIYADTAGAAFTGKTKLSDGIKAWQDKIVEYGTQQGFKVNE